MRAGKSFCALSALLLLIASASPSLSAEGSICYGTSERGKLEHGVKLPSEGKNFISYGTVPELAGRTYVHGLVREIFIEAYSALETDQPGKVYKFAETGYASGGKFAPHKTHQNGSSIDFIVPVVDESGHSVHLPTDASNSYGYTIEFDKSGRYEGYRIDFEALAAHLVALDKAAKKRGITLRRAIFDPALSPRLYSTPSGDYLKKHVLIPRKNSWVRHDEHYHVDFDLDCKPYRN